MDPLAAQPPAQPSGQRRWPPQDNGPGVYADQPPPDRNLPATVNPLLEDDDMEPTFSEACERNKAPILAVLQRHFGNTRQVFEVGSGTGQHAEHFARALPHLIWQCADLAPNLPPLRTRLQRAGLANTPAPLAFDMAAPVWPTGFDAVFSANTLHIMPWPLAAELVYQAGLRLPAGGLLLLYGPFKYGGSFTSASNLEFDQWLRATGAGRGIRDVESVRDQAQAAGLALTEDNSMPANNQLLVFTKHIPRG